MTYVVRVFCLSLIIIVLLLSIISNSAFAQENGTLVYFMKKNSSAKLYLKVMFSADTNVPLYPIMYKYPEIINLYHNSSIGIIPTPSSVQSSSQSSYNVTYTITAKSNIAGTFELDVGGCTNSTFVPLVMGLNESQVDPQIYRNFHTGWVSMSCPPVDAFISQIYVIGYSGLTTKIASENSTWINPTHVSTWQFFPPPLQQMKQGITFDQIKCSSNFNFLLVIRDDHTVEPACVKSNTMLRLENQGWITLSKFESMMPYPYPYQKPKAMPSETLR